MVLLDSIRMMITDAPELRDNQLYVSKKFLDDSEEFFNQKSELPFKVGAILIDAGHGGKDPGALKTYKINGKNVTIQEKDITLKVSKMLAAKGKEMGGTIAVKAYARFEKGEGLEKREDDFADEVAKMAGK